VGRIIGKAIYDGKLLDCYFTRSFYKFMLGIDVDWRDMEAVDPEFHKSLEWIMNNDITDVLDLTFSSEVKDFGKESFVDLKENGANILVTQENKEEYVRLITEQKLSVAIKDQIFGILGRIL
jgi:E3 ubiquitin-protein ligase HUWE1